MNKSHLIERYVVLGLAICEACVILGAVRQGTLQHINKWRGNPAR